MKIAWFRLNCFKNINILVAYLGTCTFIAIPITNTFFGAIYELNYDMHKLFTLITDSHEWHFDKYDVKTKKHIWVAVNTELMRGITRWLSRAPERENEQRVRTCSMAPTHFSHFVKFVLELKLSKPYLSCITSQGSRPLGSIGWKLRRAHQRMRLPRWRTFL